MDPDSAQYDMVEFDVDQFLNTGGEEAGLLLARAYCAPRSSSTRYEREDFQGFQPRKPRKTLVRNKKKA
jgi:hypothetical protein